MAQCGAETPKARRDAKTATQPSGSSNDFLCGGLATFKAASRRSFMLGSAALLASGSFARAETYPDKPIRMVVPFAPGGPVDIMARQMAQALSTILPERVYVENRAGANGIIGTGLVARSAPDGYTLLLMSGSHTANVSIYKKLPYDPITDFIGITQLSESSGMVLVVHPEFPANTVQEFVALVKKEPTKYAYGHGGVGNATNVSAELFKAAAGIEMTPVPYTGGGGPITALLGQQIAASFSATTVITPFIKAGSVKPLVISGRERSPVLPDVPTVVETGYPDAVFAGFFGLWFPKDTPADRVARIHDAAVAALKTAEVSNFLTSAGDKIVASSPAEFAEFLKQDVQDQIAIAKRIGLKQVE